MNIKLIKAEIEKLSLMLSSWDSEESISAIERDIVLDKLKKLYDLIRFDTVATTEATPATPAAETEQSEEKDVEVELIFAEDEFPEEELADDEEQEDEFSPVSELIAATVASALAGAAEVESSADAEPEVEVEVIYDEEQSEQVVESEPEQEPIPAIEPIVAEEAVVEPAVAEEKTVIEEVVAPEPTQEAEPTPAPEIAPEPTPEPAPAETHQPDIQMNSLFNIEEVRRPRRSKHQRMMSIYSDSEPHQEKVVDISKIFNVDIDEPVAEEPAPAPKPEPAPVATVAPAAKPMPIVEEKPATLADAITAPQTLADTLTAHTPLAEEINNARMHSLRDGIGLNDKFLMIRDLFDGDGEAYESAINALDGLETMDDCMIHIIENYAWNPDSEGSKFIMKLLERKLS